MRVKSVRKTNRTAPVYDLEVPSQHNFSVNKGIIVHNSIDATRYALQKYWARKGN